MPRSFLTPVALALLALASGRAAGPGQPPAEDYTKAVPRDWGVTPVPPKKDPKTGFVVGGKNSTALVQGLTELAGRSIADVEDDMRPGRLSTAGFLGPDERLLEVLAADNRLVVEELGLTHQELARHLHLVGAVAAKIAATESKEFTYHGRRYRVRAEFFRATARSPFEDDTKTNCEVALWNLDNERSLKFSLLVPHMIERYGFYEGKGTRYRVDPRAIVAVFDFLKKDKPR